MLRTTKMTEYSALNTGLETQDRISIVNAQYSARGARARTIVGPARPGIQPDSASLGTAVS